jgi:hypothetical protein
MNLLEFDQVRGNHEILIDGDAADIIDISHGNRGPVNL